MEAKIMEEHVRALREGVYDMDIGHYVLYYSSCFSLEYLIGEWGITREYRTCESTSPQHIRALKEAYQHVLQRVWHHLIDEGYADAWLWPILSRHYTTVPHSPIVAINHAAAPTTTNTSLSTSPILGDTTTKNCTTSTMVASSSLDPPPLLHLQNTCNNPSSCHGALPLLSRTISSSRLQHPSIAPSCHISFITPFTTTDPHRITSALLYTEYKTYIHQMVHGNRVATTITDQEIQSIRNNNHHCYYHDEEQNNDDMMQSCPWHCPTDVSREVADTLCHLLMHRVHHLYAHCIVPFLSMMHHLKHGLYDLFIQQQILCGSISAYGFERCDHVQAVLRLFPRSCITALRTPIHQRYYERTIQLLIQRILHGVFDHDLMGALCGFLQGVHVPLMASLPQTHDKQCSANSLRLCTTTYPHATTNRTIILFSPIVGHPRVHGCAAATIEHNNQNEPHKKEEGPDRMTHDTDCSHGKLWWKNMEQWLESFTSQWMASWFSGDVVSINNNASTTPWYGLSKEMMNSDHHYAQTPLPSSPLQCGQQTIWIDPCVKQRVRHAFQYALSSRFFCHSIPSIGHQS